MPDSKMTGPFTITAASADEGVIESIKYPNRFFSAINIGTGLNWLPEVKVNLWYNDGNKTIYDPCPPSWMTMLGKSNPRALGALVSWNTSGNPAIGWNTTGPTAGTTLYPSDPIIFPAAGYRSENDGSVAPQFYGHSRIHGGESIPIEGQIHGSMYWFHGYYGLIETLCPIGQAISIRCVKQTQ
jgi:hypothetical protein